MSVDPLKGESLVNSNKKSLEQKQSLFLGAWLRTLRGSIAIVFVAFFSILLSLLLFCIYFLKIFLPPFKSQFNQWAAHVGEAWISLFSFVLFIFSNMQVKMSGRDLHSLSYHKNYFLISNHVSWLDIIAIQQTLNKKIPFIRFFLKSELFWIPVLGLAWKVLGFPFLKRYSKEKLQRHPDKMLRDKETIDKACQRLKEIPFSLISFVEGTRFRGNIKDVIQEKVGEDSSNAAEYGYKFLLKPKAGGVHRALQVLGPYVHSVLDITLLYNARGKDRVSFWEALKGKPVVIEVHIQERALPQYKDSEKENRQITEDWLNPIWEEKDHWLAQHLTI